MLLLLLLGLIHHVAVDLEDQLAEQRRADRVEARSRARRTARCRAPAPARARTRRACASRPRARWAACRRAFPRPTSVQPAHDDVLDLVLALLGVLAQRERDVVEHVHRAEQRAVLEQQPELLAHLEQVVVGHVRHRLAMHEDVPVIGVQQPDHVLDAHRLARTRRPQDHRHHPLRQAHVQARGGSGCGRTPYRCR